MFNKKIIKLVLTAGIVVLGWYATWVLAGSGNMNIGTVAKNVTDTISNLVKLLTAGAYMGGFALTIAALFKFKQHKDNPQQVQLGTCIAMLLIGVSLIFLPSLITTGGETIFGSSKQEGKASGQDSI